MSDNPFDPPADEQLRVDVHQAAKILQVAICQRQIIIAYAVVGLLVAATMIGSIRFPDPDERAAFTTAVTLCWLFLLLVRVALTYRLAAALEIKIGSAVLLTIFSCWDVIGFFILLYISSRATSMLRAAGVRVGLLGARQADLDRLWDEANRNV